MRTFISGNEDSLRDGHGASSPVAVHLQRVVRMHESVSGVVMLRPNWTPPEAKGVFRERRRRRRRHSRRGRGWKRAHETVETVGRDRFSRWRIL